MWTKTNTLNGTDEREWSNGARLFNNYADEDRQGGTGWRLFDGVDLGAES